MNCARFETLLSDYMDGLLDSRVGAAMDQHSRECSSCPALLEEVRQLRTDLAEFPEVATRPEMIERILEKTSGRPERGSFWRDLVLPGLKPFLTQRYAFATLLIFAFLSFAVNVMGPGFSASSASRLSPSAIIARADQISGQVYKKWREFNDFKSRVSEEFWLFKEDVLGRLDYHLVTILFESYQESMRETVDQADEKAPKENEPQERVTKP